MTDADKNKIQTYEQYIDEQRQQYNDKVITSSVNALGTLAATLGIGATLANKQRPGITTAAGAAGAMTGYHGMRILGASPAARLIVAAITGAGAAGTAYIAMDENDN